MRDPLADARSLVPRVYAYVAYRLGDGPDAEDVTSRVFERALQYRHSWDHTRGEPIAWLIGIARRCIEDGRHDPRLVSLDGVDLATSGSFEEETVARLELQSAIETLSLRDRELIALRYGADLNSRQIAAALGLSSAAVRVALHRALERLRGCLSDESAPSAIPLRGTLVAPEEAR